MIPLASSKHNLYDIYLLLCVQYWTPDDGQRNCPKHVEFYSKNKFEKLVRLVGFIIRIYHDARSSECQFRWDLIDCNPHLFPNAVCTTNKRRCGGNERVVISYLRKFASITEDGRFLQQSVIHNPHWCMDLLVQGFLHVWWRRPTGVARRSTAWKWTFKL